MSADKPVKMIQLEFINLDWLYKCYLRFVAGGGIYFFSEEEFSLGDDIFLVLNIAIDAIQSKYPMHTEIVWKNSQIEGRGYGVAFGSGEVAQSAQRDIESLLKNILDSDKKTFTM